MAGTGSSFPSPRIRDSLAAIHQRTLELIVHCASLQDVLGALCDGIDALDPDVISSVLLADADGQHLWPAAGRRVPDDYKQLITPLPIRTVQPDLQRFLAKRMGATTRAVDSSHVAMLSQPAFVVDVIRAAVSAVQGASATA